MHKTVFDPLNRSVYHEFIKSYGFVIALAVCLWLVYGQLGSAADYNVCYTWMVKEPERLQSVAAYPWTLNPPWFAPFFAPFIALPGRAGYIFFLGFTIAILILGAKSFGGKSIPALLSAQFFWILYWGQIEAYAILGLLVAKMALSKKSWKWMLLALIFASFKPQVGLLPVLYYWWWIGKDRWKAAFGMLCVFVLSLLIWGPWPLWYMQGIAKFAGDHHADSWNASIGLLALPLFIPALLIPMEREKRIIALTATALLASPYMPYYSTIILLIMGIPLWAYIFAFNGYLVNLIGARFAWNAVVLLPISVLAWLYWPFIRLWSLKLLRKDQKPISDLKTK